MDKLLAFLPEFERNGPYGQWRGGDRQEDGSLTMPWFDYDSAVHGLIHVAYKSGWVLADFDWMPWEAQAYRFVNDPSLLQQADVATLARLLTAHLRADRFTEGHLAKMVEMGHIMRILQRIEQLRSQVAAGGDNTSALGLLSLLESFNRKERFFVVNGALGGFKLSVQFRKTLASAFGPPVPEDAFVAMDYHLDWLHAALELHRDGKQGGTFPNLPENRVANGNQEDVDLLVAFQDGINVSVLLIEAKAGAAWSNSQMESKSRRYEAIFGGDGRRYEPVQPQFGLMSPTRPTYLRSDTWPAWMRPSEQSRWIEMKVPVSRNVLFRSDEQGHPSINGSHYTVEAKSRPALEEDKPIGSDANGAL